MNVRRPWAEKGEELPSDLLWVRLVSGLWFALLRVNPALAAVTNRRTLTR